MSINQGVRTLNREVIYQDAVFGNLISNYGTYKIVRELKCWKISRELRIEISKVIKGFPAHEKFELVSQMRRASRSVTNNIAEGFGRYHYQEFIRFCRIGRGSLTELSDHLTVALDENYIDKIAYDELRAKTERCIALINGFITYLERRKRKPAKMNVEEPSELYGIDSLLDPETDQPINESTDQRINEINFLKGIYPDYENNIKSLETKK